MTEEQIFYSQLEQKSVSTIITEYNNKQIDLNAKYQRDIVWKNDKKSAFVNSVFKGIIPNNLIFNHDQENHIYICVDGKQRITSLLEFSTNTFYFEWNNEFLFYNNIPGEYADNKLVREMTMQERAKFDTRSIPIVKYINLVYADQIDIFNRIQNGMSLSPGELIISVIENDKICDIFKKFCEGKKTLITKFIKSGRDRQGHVLLLTYLLYLLESSEQKIPDKKDKEKLLKSLNTLKKINDCLKKFESKLNIYFSKDLFNNSQFIQYIKKMNQNLFFSLLLVCKEEYADITKLDVNELGELRKILLSTIHDFLEQEEKKNKIGNKKSFDAIKEVNRLFFKNKKLISISNIKDKENNQIEDNSNEVNVSEEEIENSEAEYVIHQIKNKKTIKNNNNINKKKYPKIKI